MNSTKERALAALITEGPMHRADLARFLDVSRTTVTNLTQALMSEGILEPGTGATMKAPIRIAPAAGVLVSVVFRLRDTFVALGSLDGRDITLRSVQQDPLDRGADRLVAAVKLARGLLGDADEPRVLMCHVAVNTQIDVRTGEVMGGEASLMWTGVNPMTTMNEALGAPVAVENTARLLALTEHLAHGGGKARNLIYVHLSYGVTMGQVVDGAIAQGSHGGAGELGHMSIDRDGLPCECANRGCLMQYVDEKAVLVRARAILGPDATLASLLASVAQGSRPCRSLLGDVGTELGEALVNVCHLLDPDVIIVGGALAAAGEWLVAPVREAISRRALPLNSRGLEVTAATATSEQEFVAASLHSLRNDVRHVEDMVSRVCGSA